MGLLTFVATFDIKVWRERKNVLVWFTLGSVLDIRVPV